MSGYRVLSALLFLAALVGCDSSQAPVHLSSYIDESIVEFHGMGLLGTQGHPVQETLEWQVEGEDSQFPGGMVVCTVDTGSRAQGILQKGDVIVGVQGEFLPSKEDPSLDLVELIEGALSKDEKALKISLLRDSKQTEVELTADVQALEDGFPDAITRFQDAARSGTEALVALQAKDGSFPAGASTVDATMTVTAMAGLSLIAGGHQKEDAPHHANLNAARDYLSANVEKAQSPFALAGSLIFFSELKGAGSTGSTVLQSSVMPGSSGLDPWKIQAIPVEGADLEGWLKSSSGKPGKPTPPKTLAPSKIESLPISAESLKGLGLDDPLLTSLQECLQKLLGLQQEDGGWKTDDEASYSELTLATNFALLALGVAERVGVQSPNEAIEKACAYLKANTNDGSVISKLEEGFDRRSEAGRSAGAAAAFMALSVVDTDPFLRDLTEYHRKYEEEIPHGPLCVPWHILNTAIINRQLGKAHWERFYYNFRHLLVSLQTPTGSFLKIPGSQRKAIAFESDVDGEAWRTALYSLILNLQEDAVPGLLAQARHPLQKKRDGDGKILESQGDPMSEMGLQPGAQVMQFGSMEEAQEFLKSMGLDPEDMEVQTMKKDG